MVFPKILSSQQCPRNETESLQRTGARTCVGLEAAEWLPWLLKTPCQLSARGWISSRGNAKLHELLIVSSAPFFLRSWKFSELSKNPSLGKLECCIAIFQSVRQNVCIHNLHTNHYREVYLFFFSLCSEQFKCFVHSFSFHMKESV